MKRVLLCLCAMTAALFMYNMPVHATETPTETTENTNVTTTDDSIDSESDDSTVTSEVMGIMKISVQYSTGIPLDPQDNFIIYYQSKDAKYSGTLELTANELAGKLGELELKCGPYNITGCNYVGVSDEIVKQGFAYTSEFNVTSSENTTDTFYLYIGEEMVEILKSQSSLVNVVKDNYDYGQAEATKEYEENGENVIMGAGAPSALDEPTTESTSEQKTTEKQVKSSSSSGSNIAKAIPILLFVILALGAAYILKLKGKF